MNLNQHTSIIPGVQEGAAVRLPHPIQSIEYLNYDLVVTEKQDPTSSLEARALVHRAISLIPDLTVNGAGLEWRTIRKLTREAVAALQAERQAELYSDWVLRMVGLGLDFKLCGLDAQFRISEREMPHAG